MPARPRTALPLLALLVLLAPAATLAGGDPQTQPAGAHSHHDHQGHDATVSHPFDDVERWETVFDDPTRAQWQKPGEIPAAIGLKEGMVVADIGAGTGYFERFFSKAVGPKGRVYAVDIEPKMVAHIESRAAEEKTPNVVAVLAEPDDPKLPAAGVDVIFVCDTWHHINDRLDYLKRLAASLAPGGRLAIVDFRKKPLPVGPPPEHKLAREVVMDELAQAGWSTAGESDLLPYQYLLIFTPPAAPR